MLTGLSRNIDLNLNPDMISRSLGPEFGGSIGLMFFLAKVCACGEYVLGLVEAILDVFGSDPGKFLGSVCHEKFSS